MTRILIVADDVEQGRSMARVFGKLRPDYFIVLAQNGVEATRLMREKPADLVLTDLQMPEMDGFALLTWMQASHPDVPVFTMSDVGDAETAAMSVELGASDYFPKPLDARAVLQRLSETLAQSVRGHVQNVSLASLLQLLEMDRKTCTLTITFDDKQGVLVIRRGVLMAAQTGELTGQAAAIAIIAWQSPSILISRHREVDSASIQAPLGFILMEAMRIQDEEARANPCASSDSSWSTPRRTWRPTGSPSQWPAAPGSEHGANDGQVNGASSGELGLPSGARALALVETATGHLLRSASHPDCPLPELAQMASQVLQQEAAMLKLCIATESVEELVLSTSSRCDVIRPLSAHAFALLVFAPEDTNLVMARIELEQFIVDSQLLAAQRTP
jgi:DNA-binding response OmpR family regulator